MLLLPTANVNGWHRATGARIHAAARADRSQVVADRPAAPRSDRGPIARDSGGPGRGRGDLAPHRTLKPSGPT